MTAYADIWKNAETLPWCLLVCTGRTGADALQSQLDSHPEIFGYNGGLYFHDFWINSTCLQSGQPLLASDIADEFIGSQIHCLKSRYDVNERKNELGENRNQSIDIDTMVFKGHIVKLLDGQPVTCRNFLVAVFIAYALSLGQDLSKKKVFFHHVHHVRKVDPFMEDFPAAKVIAMTRDPRAAYVSGVDNWRSSNPAAENPYFPKYVLWRVIDEINPLLKYGERFHVMRLEDLSNENVLNSVCLWLGITFDPCVMKSSWAGLRWWGDKLSNASDITDENEFVKQIRRNRWKQRLGYLDNFVLNNILFKRLNCLSYEIGRGGNAFFFPIVFLLILLPTIYERKWFSIRFIFDSLCKGKIKRIVFAYYHVSRRILYFYKLFFGRYFKNDVSFCFFSDNKESTA